MLRSILKDTVSKFVIENCIKIKETSTQLEYYCAYNLLKQYDFTFEDLTNGQIDGGGDEGIDSLYCLINGKVISSNISEDELFKTLDKKASIKLILIQSKEHNGFSDNAVKAIRDGFSCITNNDYDLSNDKFITQATLFRKIWRQSVLIGCENKIEVINSYCCYANSKENALENPRINSAKEKLFEQIRLCGMIPNIDFYGCSELIDKYKEPIEYRKSLRIIKKFDYIKKQDSPIKGYLCLVNAREYYKFICDSSNIIEDKIFEENIRDFQGKDQEVNSKIIETINSAYADKFWCLNNGVTMLAYNVSPFEDELVMSNYQIINGCQTSYSLDEAFKEGKDYIDFEIIIKVIEIDAKEDSEMDELILKIIESTNSQTRIDSFAFKANNVIHKRIEECFKLKVVSYYYERKPKFYERRGIPKTKILNPVDLFKVVYSVYYKNPSMARNTPTALFNKNHDTVFNLEVNLEWYWIAYRLYMDVLLNIEKLREEQAFIDDKEGEFILRNGSLHITRVIFALINGSDFQTTRLTSNDIGKVLGAAVYTLYNDQEMSIEDKVRQSIEIIKEVVKEFPSKDFDSFESAIRTAEFDKNITRYLIECLNLKGKNQSPEINNEEAIISFYRANLLRYMDYYKYVFYSISKTGDLRFNFKDRLDGLEYIIMQYWQAMNKVDYDNMLDIIKIVRSDVVENDRDKRLVNAKKIYDQIASMKNILEREVKN